MACVYCRPDRSETFLDASQRLRTDDWMAITRGLIRIGIRRVRITGGEPLLHREITEIVHGISSLGVDDLALTTNGSRLEELANPLRQAGLRRLNVSLDSLEPETFANITRGASLGAVLRGIDAARAVGFDEIKTNTVLMRGVNDHEIERIVDWAWSNGITPRFIEWMPIGVAAATMDRHFYSRDEAIERLSGKLRRDVQLFRATDRGPAEYLPARDGDQTVGFISGSSRSFCDRCDRIRVTSQGRVRACLAVADGLDLAPLLRAPNAQEQIEAAIHAAWNLKPPATWRGCQEPTARSVSMRMTGG